MESFPENNLNKDVKKDKWEEVTKNVSVLADRLGKPVDLGIKESVISLNAHDFETRASCEGHIEYGLPYPWVDVEFCSEQEILESFPSFKEDKEIINNKYGGSLRLAEKFDPDLYSRTLLAIDFMNKRKEESRLKICALLDEFYLSRANVSDESKIKAIFDSGGRFRLETSSNRGIGKDNWKKFDDHFLSLKEDEKINFLKNNQKEMSDFALFLKNKYFESK